LKYIHAARANKTIVTIKRDELLIPVFLAMSRILSPTIRVGVRQSGGRIADVNRRGGGIEAPSTAGGLE
jgi:hypothetical protein